MVLHPLLLSDYWLMDVWGYYVTVCLQQQTCKDQQLSSASLLQKVHPYWSLLCWENNRSSSVLFICISGSFVIWEKFFLPGTPSKDYLQWKHFDDVLGSLFSWLSTWTFALRSGMSTIYFSTAQLLPYYPTYISIADENFCHVSKLAIPWLLPPIW